MIRLLALLLLVPSFALAQDQSLAPDGTNGPSTVFNNVTGAACSTSTACSSAACETDVDESPDSGDNLYLCTETQDTAIRFTFPTPSANPDTGTNAQTVDLIISCTDADGTNNQDCNGSPTFDLELICGSTPTTIFPFTNEAVAAVDTDFAATFTYPGACASDGSDLGFEIVMGRSGGAPGDRRWIAIEAIEWEVTHAGGGGPVRRRVWVIQ